MPPIRIIIADGEENEDVVIKVSDEGGLSLSKCPALSTHPRNLAHPINKPSQHTHSTHHLKSPSRHSLSTRLIHTSYQYIISKKPLNIPSTYPLNQYSLSHTISPLSLLRRRNQAIQYEPNMVLSIHHSWPWSAATHARWPPCRMLYINPEVLQRMLGINNWLFSMNALPWHSHFCIFTPHFCIFTPHFCVFTPHFCVFTPHFCVFTPPSLHPFTHSSLSPGHHLYDSTYTYTYNCTCMYSYQGVTVN